MWRGRLFSQQHTRRTISLTRAWAESSCSSILVHLITPLQCLSATFPSSIPDVLTIFRTFLIPSPPLLSSYLPLMIFFIWRLPTDMLIFNIRALNILSPSLLLFGFLSALSRFGSDTPHLCRSRGREGGGDHMTVIPDFPPIKRHLQPPDSTLWLPSQLSS